MRKITMIVPLMIIMLLGTTWASLSYYKPAGQVREISGIEWRTLYYERERNVLFISFFYTPPSSNLPDVTVITYFAPSHVFMMVDADHGRIDVGARRPNWGELEKVEFYGNDVRGGLQLLGILSSDDIRVMME